MRKHILILTLLLMPYLCLVTSCGTARRSEPIMGRMEIKDESVARGKIVFYQNCHRCHPGGEAGVGPGINNIPHPGPIVRFRVRSKAFLLGLGRMPSFKKNEISKQELTDLVHYLSALKKHDEDAHGSRNGDRNFPGR